MVYENEDAKNKDFVKRVLERYRQKKPVSDLARRLCKNETPEIFNLRFKKAKEAIEKEVLR